MSSLNQLISEIAHSVQQADSVPVRRAIRQGIIHARNELIRHIYSNHNYVDKVLKQKFKLKLANTDKERIKKTINKVPRPVRLPINLPFHSVDVIIDNEIITVAYIITSVNRFYNNLPGMNNVITYDYINDYLYLNNINEDVEYVIIESVFEYPHQIIINYDDENEENLNINDDDEFFLPEDLVNSVKKLVLETFNNTVIRDTNEIPTPNLVK